MSEEVLNVPDITCGPLTLDEIKYYFRQKPDKMAASKRVFRRQESESSDELSSSFEEDLKAIGKYRPFKKSKKEAFLTGDEVFVEGYEGIFDEPPIMQKSSCKIDKTDQINDLKIRESLSLATERDSMHVTKTRPKYTVESQSLDEDNSLLAPAFSSDTFTIPHIQIEKPVEEPIKTPGKNITKKKDKFAHVKSPVAEYINSPHTPLYKNVNGERSAGNKGATIVGGGKKGAKIGGGKTRASKIGGKKKAKIQVIEKLPNKRLIKQTPLFGSCADSATVFVDGHLVFAKKKKRKDFLNFSFDSADDEVSSFTSDDGEYDGFKEIFGGYPLDDDFGEEINQSADKKDT